jgi:hypothetical protein
MYLEEILIHLLIVVIGSLIGSFIFTMVFIYIIKRSILASASKLISAETKQKVAEWLQEVVKNGISESLKDPKVKAIALEILELIKEKFIKEEERKR